MSGRRSSSVEGRPVGITGTTRATGAGAIVNSAGGLPISTAMACSKAARWTPTLSACERVDSTWARADATSERPATPWR